MKRLTALLSLLGVMACLSCNKPSVADDKTPKGSTKVQSEPTGEAEAQALPEKVIKSDAEWQRILTPAQFYVTRQKGTERANTGPYAHYRGKGTFSCVCCGSTLFDARHKFESGTGWPSFYQPVDPRRIMTEEDHSMFEVRMEVMCSTCGAHLGHVFGDGPRPTGLRYCINSVALKLNKPPAAPKAKAKAKPSAKDSTKEKAPAKAKDSADETVKE